MKTLACLARAWKVPLGVWIALAVTALIPAGCVALFLALLVKARQFGAS